MPRISSSSRCATEKAGGRATVSQSEARRLLLLGCALATPPQRASRNVVGALVRRLGFLQVDSINSVERAHHLILHSRLDGYAPSMLAHVTETQRLLFEHWTHDASLIRSDWRQWWSHRFVAARERMGKSAWFQSQLGRNGKRHIAQVRDAIRERGPLMARDFPRPKRAGAGWWDWSPQKAALEYLWRTGDIAIHSRKNFDKVYDLAVRVHPEPISSSSRSAMIDWACDAALARLGCATARELSHFMHAVTIQEARAWCLDATASGRVIRVVLERGDSKPLDGVATVDWRDRANQGVPTTPARLLAPFDPLIRDRARLLGLFNFDYRFEAFTPEAKRRFGYYTMPVLFGEELVARVDLASDREAGVLRVSRIFREKSCAARAARAAAREACERLAGQLQLRVALPSACEKTLA